MKTLDMNLHDFRKRNLVTTPKGDLYECTICKTSGYRIGLASFIKVTDNEYKKSLKCNFLGIDIETKHNLPKEVMVNNMPYIGLKYGMHKVIPCPDEYKKKFTNDVWVYSESRKEAVRLLPGEYEKC